MANGKKPDFWNWIGLNTNPDYATAPKWLGSFIGWFVSLVGLVLFVIAVGVIGWLVKSLFFPAGTNPAESIRNLGLAAAAMIGVPFLIWRSIVAQKQVDVSEQGLITDRINKAVEGLGAQKTATRIGRVLRVKRAEERPQTRGACEAVDGNHLSALGGGRSSRGWRRVSFALPPAVAVRG